jgi:predicted dehydrogenase
MKALVVGLGSMGKRRVRNMQALGIRDIVGTDIRKDRCEESRAKYSITAVPDFTAGMALNPDLVIISTPPHLHLDYARQAAEAGKHVFTEFSWTEHLSEFDVLDDLCASHDVVGAPSCTQRFQESVRRMRDLVAEEAIGRVIFLLFHSGQWAPDWHPWESTTDFYLGHKAMGGGREQVSFELDWIRWVMGSVDHVSAIAGKMTTLPADIDDLYQITLGFQNGAVGSVTVDMIQRAPNRLCTLMSEEGQMVWDYTAGVLRVYTAADRRWTEYREPPDLSGYLSEGHVEDEPMYVAEMQAFLEAVGGRAPFPNRYRDERSLLEIVHAIERSSAEGRRVYL